MVSLIYTECRKQTHYAECHLCWVPFMLSVIYTECHKQTHYAEDHCAEGRGAHVEGRYNATFYWCEYLISVYTSVLPLPIPSSQAE
jgi:hypothetical protein